MHPTVAVAFAFALALAMGCRAAPPLETPTTWVGTVPCADCPGRRMTLTLQPDSTYRMRSIYLEAENGRDKTFIASGRWSLGTDGRRIALLDDREITLLEVAEPGRLRLLDREGRAIVTEQNVDLLIADKVDPIEERPGLEDARWVLVWLAGTAAPRSEAWIRLDPSDWRITGHGGCNRMSGTYHTAGDSLSFGPLAMTRMACPHMEHEGLFGRALDATRRYALRGDTLELLDTAGAAVARLAHRE